MKCEQCGETVIGVISDRMGGFLNRYVPVGYYCDHCDRFYIVEKYRDRLNPEQYAEDITRMAEESRQRRQSKL